MRRALVLISILLTISCHRSVFTEKPAEKNLAKQAPYRSGSPTPEPGEGQTFDGIRFVWIPAGEFQMGSPDSGWEWDAIRRMAGSVFE